MCPDLRDLDEDTPGVFFDEASLRMILFQKKLFQAINRPVKLGQTNTGMYSYDVYVHRRMLVVANNTFAEEYKHLNEADKDWIDQNVIPVFVKKGDLYPRRSE